jgi:hypothetical protein
VVAASALAGLVEPAALAWAQAALDAPAVPVELVAPVVPAVRVELLELAVPAALAALLDLVLTAELPMSTGM